MLITESILYVLKIKSTDHFENKPLEKKPFEKLLFREIDHFESKTSKSFKNQSPRK